MHGEWVWLKKVEAEARDSSGRRMKMYQLAQVNVADPKMTTTGAPHLLFVYTSWEYFRSGGIN